LLSVNDSLAGLALTSASRQGRLESPSEGEEEKATQRALSRGTLSARSAFHGSAQAERALTLPTIDTFL